MTAEPLRPPAAPTSSTAMPMPASTSPTGHQEETNHMAKAVTARPDIIVFDSSGNTRRNLARRVTLGKLSSAVASWAELADTVTRSVPPYSLLRLQEPVYLLNGRLMEHGDQVEIVFGEPPGWLMPGEFRPLLAYFTRLRTATEAALAGPHIGFDDDDLKTLVDSGFLWLLSPASEADLIEILGTAHLQVAAAAAVSGIDVITSEVIARAGAGLGSAVSHVAAANDLEPDAVWHHIGVDLVPLLRRGEATLSHPQLDEGEPAMDTTTTSPATESVPLEVGQQVRFSRPSSVLRLWWDVRATSVDGRWVVLTQQTPFEPAGVLRYTIIDWQRGVRGPCNLVGQGWDFDPDPDASARRLVRALEYDRDLRSSLEVGQQAGEDDVDDVAVEVSYRNNISIEIAAVRSPRAATA